MTAMLAAAIAMACGATRSDRVAGTVLALDRGIDSLTDSSADFRGVFQNVAAQLPRGADTAVGAAITRFLDRAPREGDDFRCSGEFVRLRARDELIRIEQRLLGTPEDPREPQACYATPFAVDLTHPPGSVEIYGYDFDLVRPEMVIVDSAGYRDVSAAIVARTHYHLTLRLDTSAVRMSRSTQLFGLTWGHVIHYAIPVVRPGAVVCSCAIEELPAGRLVDFTPPELTGPSGRATPANASAGWANAIIDYQSNELAATVCMTSTDSGVGRVVRSGCTRAFILTIDPDRTIEWLFGRTVGRAGYARGNKNAVERADGELIREWRFGGPGVGRTAPRVAIELGKIRVVSTARDGCVSPIAYLEARRTGAIAPTTARSLDAKLSKLDPAIAALRPRFAPPMTVKDSAKR